MDIYICHMHVTHTTYIGPLLCAFVVCTLHALTLYSSIDLLSAVHVFEVSASIDSSCEKHTVCTYVHTYVHMHVLTVWCEFLCNLASLVHVASLVKCNSDTVH